MFMELLFLSGGAKLFSATGQKYLLVVVSCAVAVFSPPCSCAEINCWLRSFPVQKSASGRYYEIGGAPR